MGNQLSQVFRTSRIDYHKELQVLALILFSSQYGFQLQSMIDDCGNFLPVAYAELDNLIPKIQVGSQKVYLMRDIAQASISRSLPDFSVKDQLSKSATNRPVNPADISRQCSDIKKGLIDLARIYWLVVSNVTLRFPLSLDSREITGFTGRSTILEPFLNNYILDEISSKIIAINPQKSYVNPFKQSAKEIQTSFRDRLRSKLVGKQDVSSATDNILNRVEDAMTFNIGSADMPLPPNKISSGANPADDFLAPNMVTAIIAAYGYGDFRYFRYYMDGRPRPANKPLKFAAIKGAGGFEITRFGKGTPENPRTDYTQFDIPDALAEKITELRTQYQDLINSITERAGQLSIINLERNSRDEPAPLTKDRYTQSIYGQIRTFMNLRDATVVRAYEILREFVFSTKSERMCLGAENICIDPMVLYENRRKDFNKRVTEIVTLITRYYENSLPIIRRIDELYVKNVLPNFKKTA